FWKALRLATSDQVASELTRIMALFVPRRPWEHHAPARTAYSLPLTKATSATPLTKLPKPGLVWLEGRPSTTVETAPLGAILEMRAVKSPVYGPAPRTYYDPRLLSIILKRSFSPRNFSSCAMKTPIALWSQSGV